MKIQQVCAMWTDVLKGGGLVGDALLDELHDAIELRAVEYDGSRGSVWSLTVDFADIERKMTDHVMLREFLMKCAELVEF